MNGALDFFALAFFWPPVRWVSRKIEQHRELACDQLAERIDRVLDLHRRRSPKWAALAVVSGAALALSGTALAVEEGAATPARPVDDASIQQVVREHGGEIRACYEAALVGSPGLQGTLVFGWSITKGGTFADGCVTSSDFSSDLIPKRTPQQDNDLWNCVSAAIRGWRFPPPKGGQKIEVSYPFVFKPVAPPLTRGPGDF